MYLPGDLVHIVVGAPSNVVQIITTMPDGQRISLDFERRTHTWHGHWEVPYGFKKGSYLANLIATDVEGKIFEGATNSFYIGEPALVTLIGITSTKETARQEQAAKKIAAEAEILAQEAKAKQAKELLGRRPVAREEGPVVKEEEPAVEEKAAEVKEEIRPRAKPTTRPRPAAQPARSVKKTPRPKPAAVQPKESTVVFKVRLITIARSYIATREYDKAKEKLKALLKVDPENREIKSLFNRLEEVISAQEVKQ